MMDFLNKINSKLFCYETMFTNPSILIESENSILFKEYCNFYNLPINYIGHYLYRIPINDIDESKLERFLRSKKLKSINC